MTTAKTVVPITKPCLGEEEDAAVKAVLASGWLVQGDKVVEFEDAVKSVVGTQYAIACTSCTTALHMALLALGIGRDDKVVVPAYTFVATPNVVEYVGGKVVFADIDLGTFNIDMGSVRTNNAKAIIPVHLFGLCADMESVLGWSATQKASTRSRVKIVEDAACSLGSCCPSGNAGKIGDIGCFSFHPRKCVTTGEGGMVTADNDMLAKTIYALRDFGFGVTDIERHRSGQYSLPQVSLLGYNYRMTNIQGAIGVEQMKKYDRIVGERVRRAEIYNRELDGLDWLRLPIIPEGYGHTYQSYCLLVGGEGYRGNAGYREAYIRKWSPIKEQMMNTLKDDGISTRGGTHACHMLDYYADKYGLIPNDFPNTKLADALLVTIPLYAAMTDDDQQRVIDAIRRFRV